MIEDFDLWDKIKKSIQPIDKKSYIKEDDFQNPLQSFAKKIAIHRHFPEVLSFKPERKELSFSLDLHGKTLDEAFSLLSHFIVEHRRRGTEFVTIITGKGLKNEGLLKKNVPLWLENEKIKKHIVSTRKILDSRAQYGSFLVYLKPKGKKKECMY
ncbi:MAG: hypothetical protein EOM53_00565 [Alphaproteobacteria bacterium]|nr:Smr/MutS family protein [Alphaproteobacteria bacterium]NCB49164.1 hypothetical protein [Alphaproteobacteria bacterium]